MSAVWVAAIAVVTIAIAGGAAKFSASGAKDDRAMNQGTNKSQPAAISAEQRGRVRASLDALPLAFEANQGQTDPQVKYTARGNGYSVFLTANDAVFAITSAKHPAAQPSRTADTHSRPQTTEKIQSAAIDMRLVGGSLKPEIVAGNELPGLINYYVGSDPKNWHTGVKQYSSVSYKEVYPGVNMVFHGAQRQLEFDFVVSPGADPKTIDLGFKGAQRLATDASGNLLLVSSAGDVVLHKPVAYQEKDGQREVVEASFLVRNGNEVGLNLGTYDRGRELVIDPTLTYSTYLGGSAEDDAYAIAIDGTGNAYVTGQTTSMNFPTVSGAYSGSNAGLFDVFVTKLSVNGASLLYSTYIGGSGSDSGNAIAVDGSGNAFVAGGTTSSTNFPTTTGALQTTFGGGSVDGFVLELASSGGSLTFSTYLGGSGDDVANGIAIDTSGEYVVGSTTSTNFPTQGPYQPSINGTSNGFVTKLNTSGNALVYSTYLGGGTLDVATAVDVDSSGNAYVTGATASPLFPTTSGAFQTKCGSDGNCNGGLDDAFVTIFQSSGASLIYSTFLGGEGIDQGLGIAVDKASGNAYVTGLTQSSLHFPLKSALQGTFGGGTQDAFVTELNPSALVYSTYLGGSMDDAGTSIALDGNKNAYVTGQTNSPNFPTAAATQTTLGGGNDAFVSEISASGSSLVFSTYLGGALDENTNVSGGNLAAIGAVAVDSAGANIYVAGNTASSPFPTLVGSVQTTYGGGVRDAFVARFSSVADFGISASPPASVSPGNPATSTVTLTSAFGYNLPVTLSCSVSGSGSPAPSCSASNAFSTNPVTPNSSGATSTLTITTTAPAHASIRRASVLPALWLPVVGISVVGMCFVSGSRRRRRTLGVVFLMTAGAALVFLPSCGSSYSKVGGGTCSAVPSVPSGLAASSTTSTGTTLNWTASTVGTYCSVSSYTIYQNGTQIGTSTTPSFNVTGLAASTAYSFTVSASDSVGASAQSSPLNVTTGSGGTPAGNYTITITGTDANHLTHSTQVILTVN